MKVQIHSGPRPAEEDIIKATVSPDEVMRHLVKNGFDIQKTLAWIRDKSVEDYLNAQAGETNKAA